MRDELLGRPEPNDFDLVTELSSGELAQMLHGRGLSSLPPVTYARFGTALVRVAGAAIELATARRESYAPDSRKPEVEPATLTEDAQRRDFTVNALMRNLHSGELWDPLGKGLPDLEARVLRTPLDPRATFRDDPLRMLRAVRFVWQLGFAPVPRLYESIREEAHRLSIISAERIREEFVKMLRLPDADKALEDLRRTGLLEVFAPELEAMKGVEQGSFHHLDVWDHSRLVVRNAGTEDLVLTLSALLHDVGKPETRSLDDEGHIRFFGHELVGARIAGHFLDRLRFPRDDIDAVTMLVRNHMRLQTAPGISPAAARRLIRDLGPNLPRLLKLVEADANALKPGVKIMDVAAIRKHIEEVGKVTPVEKLESPLSGGEIMALLDLEPGPEIGDAKKLLLERVLEGDLQPDDKPAAVRELLAAKNFEGPAGLVLHALSQLPPQPGSVRIGISGFSGSGKTTFARELAARLPDCAVVESDVFWDPANDVLGEDWPAVEKDRLRREVLEPAGRGEPIRYRPWNWEEERLGDEVDLGKPCFLIVEGIAIFHPQMVDDFDLRIWVDAPFEEAMAEGMRRDRDEQGADREAQWRQVWIPNERAFFDRFRPDERADLRVPWFRS